MKKLLYLFGLALLLQSSFCGRKCDDFTVSLLRGPMEEYFGVYKPGNWWIYKNKDGAKKDSVYISGFSEMRNRDRTTCLENQERVFIIRNNILMNGSDLYVTYRSGYATVSVNFSLIKDQTQSAGFPQFRHDEDLNKLWSFPETYNQGNNLLDSIRINSTTYYNILRGAYGNNTYYFAKGRGLVGWTANNDTLNLTSYKIL